MELASLLSCTRCAHTLRTLVHNRICNRICIDLVIYTTYPNLRDTASLADYSPKLWQYARCADSTMALRPNQGRGVHLIMVAPEGAIDDTSGSDTVQRRLKELSTRLLKPCNVAPLGNRPRRSPAFKSEGKLGGDERKEPPGHHNALTGKYIKHRVCYHSLITFCLCVVIGRLWHVAQAGLHLKARPHKFVCVLRRTCGDAVHVYASVGGRVQRTVYGTGRSAYKGTERATMLELR